MQIRQAYTKLNYYQSSMTLCNFKHASSKYYKEICFISDFVIKCWTELKVLYKKWNDDVIHLKIAKVELKYFLYVEKLYVHLVKNQILDCPYFQSSPCFKNCTLHWPAFPPAQMSHDTLLDL